MKKILAIVTILSLVAVTALADSMTLDDQKQLLTSYGIATGQIPAPPLTDEQKQLPPDKCGTSIVNEFWQNSDRIDPSLMTALGIQAAGRPDIALLPLSYGSPAGRFLVHYVDTGAHAVYQPTVRTLEDTVPDFVVMVARIADSVYTHIIDSLGYPQPPVDGYYPIGLDDRYDIYLQDLSAQFYGLTYIEASVTSQTATSYLILDNDYQSIEKYVTRPLDAVRVTTAHEYFHAVQFGMDVTEFDGYPSSTRRQYWMEMSAVWMEEECYDAINDYYAYLPFVFEFPTVSLQSFGSSGSDLHPYGSVTFALYLSEHYAADSIIRNIWERCAALGSGSQFLQACEQIVNSYNNQASLATTMNDYSVWNYFTGQYAGLAPAGVGYSEGPDYPVIPLDKILTVRDYPLLEFSGVGDFRPQYNGTAYLLLSDMQNRTGCFVDCDSVLPIYVGLQHPGFVEWSISVIYQFLTPADSFFIDKLVVPVGPIAADSILFLEVDAFHPNQFKNIAVTITPTTVAPASFLNFTAPNVGYAISDSGGFAVRPSAVLTPYPNPAVVTKMGSSPLTFRFQVANDTANNNASANPLLLIDLYTVAGEFVKSINAGFGGEDRLGVHSAGIYETGWDMKNSAGKEVASGVYLAYARLWDSPNKGKLLAESKVKVALIR